MDQLVIKKRLSVLREWMKQYGIAYYMIPTTDYHQSEYVSDFFKVREYFSGFTGSNGTLIVEGERANLWTDGRYFVQAQKELEGTEIDLLQMGQKDVPTILEYFKKKGKQGEVVGFDGKVLSAEYGEGLVGELSKLDMKIFYEEDLADYVWTQRPELTKHPIRVLACDLYEESVSEKIEELREDLSKEQADLLFLSKLDDIMWLFNIRGADIAYNPVAFSHAIISREEVLLFVSQEAVTTALTVYAQENQITIESYEDIEVYLRGITDKKIVVDKEGISFSFWKILEQHNQLLSKKNPTELRKAIKKGVEIENSKKTYVTDSAAVCKFLYWLSNESKEHAITERDAANYLDSMRKQTEQFVELSFPTISAYGEHAAMMHYNVTERSNQTLKQEGALLIDSGGQYLGGTTDVTRTIVLGPVSEEFKRDFTAVVSGMLQLQDAVFLEGCTGRNLDILARQPLWDMYMDYKCGTGHGIGYMLNVHEGPQGIRWKYNEAITEAVLKPGMITSNEPGVYKEGNYGIRIENIMLCSKLLENEDGTFLHFIPLTLVPIDIRGIETQYLSEQNKTRLNHYHKKVYEEISVYLTENEKKWLKNVTKEIE